MSGVGPRNNVNESCFVFWMENGQVHGSLMNISKITALPFGKCLHDMMEEFLEYQTM